MYEEYYGFKTKPFSLLPDARFLYLSARHQLALDVLQYGLLHRLGVVVVTGEIGSGKTTLARHLLTQVGNDVVIGLINNTHAGMGALLPWILEAYDVGSDGSTAQQYRALVNYLLAQYAQGRNVVLIVDEAQNLSAPMLEELRVLTNVNADQDQVLQLVLVGQPELKAMLHDPQRQAFTQRIGAEYHLEPLASAEVETYIRHRLVCAGGDADIFDTDAYAAVVRCSGGVPRVINSICDLALVYGFAERCARIGVALVEDAARDKGRAPPARALPGERVNG